MLNNYTLIILALIFPPIPVVLKKGLRDSSVLVNLIWHFLGYIPAVLHSIFVITEEKQRFVKSSHDGYFYKCPSYPLVDLRGDSEDSNSTTCIEDNDDEDKLPNEPSQVIQMV